MPKSFKNISYVELSISNIGSLMRRGREGKREREKLQVNSFEERNAGDKSWGWGKFSRLESVYSSEKTDLELCHGGPNSAAWKVH